MSHHAKQMLKTSNHQLKIAIEFHLVSKSCRNHRCVCGKDLTEDEWQGLSRLKKAGRYSRHSNLNALVKQNFGSTRPPSVLEPRHLHRKTRRFDACPMGY